MTATAAPAAFIKSEENGITVYTGTVRKQAVTVCLCSSFISIYVLNASARCHRGPGKTIFSGNVADAIPLYKSAEMKAFLAAVAADQLPANVIPFAKP